MSSLWMKLQDGTLVPVPTTPEVLPAPSQIETQVSRVDLGSPGAVISDDTKYVPIAGMDALTVTNDVADARVVRFDMVGWVNADQSVLYCQPYQGELNGTAQYLSNTQARMVADWYTNTYSRLDIWLAPGDSCVVNPTAWLGSGESPAELRYAWTLTAFDLGPMEVPPVAILDDPDQA